MFVQCSLWGATVDLPDLDGVVDGARGEHLGAVGVPPYLVNATDVRIILVLGNVHWGFVVEVELK